MPKTSQYWKEYNAKRRGYLTLKKRVSRAKLKGQVVDNSPGVVDLAVVDQFNSLVVDQVVDTFRVVDRANKTPEKVVDRPDNKVVDLVLTKLIQAWKTQTNYACPPTCSHSYCANCWYFADQELIDYKGGKHG